MDIYPSSKLGFRSQLDLFKTLTTDISVESSNYMEITPNSNVSESFNPIDFTISPQPIQNNIYYDLKNSYLYLKCKVTLQNGNQLPANEPVAVTSNFFYSMFSNIIVAANGKLLHDDQGFSPYRIMIPKLITSSKADQTSFQTTTLCYPDSVYETYDTTKNPGFKTRMDLVSGSKTFDVAGPLECGFFNQSKYIPSGVQLNIRLVRSPPEFCLESSKTTATGQTGCPYKYEIEEAKLYVKAHKINQDIVREHQSLFGRGDVAKFPIQQTVVKAAQVPKGAMTFSYDMYNGLLPEYVIFGLIDSENFNGKINKNAFNFAPNKLSQITLTCSTEETTYKSIDMDYNSDIFLKAYQSLFEGVPNHDKRTGIAISRDNFKNGNCFYLFTLLPHNVSGGFVPTKIGKMTVSFSLFKVFCSIQYYVLTNIILLGQLDI